MEPCEPRGSRTVLGEAGGETPLAYSPAMGHPLIQPDHLFAMYCLFSEHQSLEDELFVCGPTNCH
jgi:hypothetical protein